MSYVLDLLPETYSVCKLPPGARPPAPPARAHFFSVTVARDEISIVCRSNEAPDGAEVEGGWRALRLRGPLDFSLVGVMARLTGPLAAAGVSVFVLSTFDTDYLLVRADALTGALQALRGAGYEVEE